MQLRADFISGFPDFIDLQDQRDHTVARIPCYCDDSHEAAAAFIVEACAKHDALVAERDILKAAAEMTDQHVAMLLRQKKQLVEALEDARPCVTRFQRLASLVDAALDAAKVPV